MKPLVFDIETLPLAASLSAEYTRDDFSPPSNYGDEAKERWHVKNEGEWRRKLGRECSFNPRLGRVLAIGSTCPQYPMLYAQEEHNEEALIRAFWEIVAVYGGKIVTFNGVGFDLPFFLARSMKYRIMPTVDAATIREWMRKYVYFQHCDLCGLLSGWKIPTKGDGLAGWAAHFGLEPNPDETKGADIAFLHSTGEHDLIKRKCLYDVAQTAEIYEIVRPYYIGNVYE